jgi:uncharacterized membrane protein YfcA
MNGLDFGWVTLVVSFLAIMVGGVVKGTVGVGLPLVALPIMASFMPVPQAIALLILPAVATSVWQSFAGGNFLATIKRFWALLLVIPVGTYWGVRALVVLDPRIIYIALGLLVSTFAIVQYRRAVLPISPRAESWANPLVGLVAGLVGGISMLVGPVLAMYLAALRLPKDVFVASISLVAWYFTALMGLMMSGNQLLSGHDLIGSTVALVPAFIGLHIGQRIRKRVNEAVFARCLTIVLLLIGLNLLIKGLI